jgi:hypothetical protein
MSIADLGNADINIKSIRFGNQGTSLQACVTIGISGNLTGPYGIHGPVPVTGLVRYLSGFVIFSLSGVTAQTDNNGAITFSTPISPPPYTTINFPIWVSNQSNIVAGNCQIDTNGVVTIYKDYNGVFTGASNGVGFPSFTVVYSTYSLN